MPKNIHFCKGVSYCECACHVEGSGIMHFMLCCNLCYKKYIEPITLKIDMNKVNKFVDEYLKWKNRKIKNKLPTAKEENMKEFEKAKNRKTKVIKID